MGELDAAKTAPTVRSLDDFCRLGRYCALLLILGEFLALSCLGSMTFMMYAGANPAVSGCGHVVHNGTNICHHLPEIRNQTGCEPQLHYQFRSVNVDFDYLCGESHHVKNSISVQMLGVLVGAALFGQMSDLFGRRLTMLVAGMGMTVFCGASAYSSTLSAFTTLRTITGFFTGGLSVIQKVYMIENIPRRHRLWIQTVVAWSPNFIIFPYLAYLAQDWATLSKVNAAVAAVGTLLTLVVYESSRWLVQKGRITEAREVMEKIGRIDGDTCQSTADELEKTLIKEQEDFAERSSKQRRYTFYHLFCTWKMVSWTLTLIIGITAAALINYALMYNMEKLSGSIFWNSAIFGAVRWLTSIIIAICDYYIPWFGRRLINQFATLFTSSALGIMAYLYWIDSAEAGGLVIQIGTIMTMSICSQLFLAKYMIANELYPTAVRLAVSAMSTTSRVGTIFAPQLFYLTVYGDHMPYFVLTLLSFLDCVAFQIFVPETKGRLLENHLPSKEQRIFYKKKQPVTEPLVEKL